MADATRETRESQLKNFLDVLRCPTSGKPMKIVGDVLISADGEHSYEIDATGIPLFATNLLSADAKSQRYHYNKIAAAYTANLDYPHTKEYMAYLDQAVLNAIGGSNLGTLVELCCGRGEALGLLGGRVRRYIGVDVSETMLRATAGFREHSNALYVQADATRTPLAAKSVDTVAILGGVHHVPDRAGLFAEVFRILKPGGKLLYREPVSDFALWRGLRALIYRLSPMLDHATERPLIYSETVPVLERVGLRSEHYRTHGLFGFCLFMNSDVLFFNRVFRFIPGICAIARYSARFDEAMLAIPGLRHMGLQVVGVATKPETRADN